MRKASGWPDTGLICFNNSCASPTKTGTVGVGNLLKPCSLAPTKGLANGVGAQLAGKNNRAIENSDLVACAKLNLTPQSVEAAIQEEFQRANKSSEPSASEPFESPVATVKHPRNSTSADDRKFQMEREVVDLKIANLGKDYLIDQLQGERNGLFLKVVPDKSNRGQLEIKLIQLNTPKS